MHSVDPAQRSHLSQPICGASRGVTAESLARFPCGTRPTTITAGFSNGATSPLRCPLLSKRDAPLKPIRWRRAIVARTVTVGRKPFWHRRPSGADALRRLKAVQRLLQVLAPVGVAIVVEEALVEACSHTAPVPLVAHGLGAALAQAGVHAVRAAGRGRRCSPVRVVRLVAGDPRRQGF